ncbi:MFS transporter [Carnobacterium antarcticum]|uniref:MFS transporter n=1 Tax=Carnobacterium antarcticum TaxID=2126436 RepID=A0ABW4NJA8_9LACT|nr:MFS transporter [Carnobacterium sp. CP1]ALV22465.1 Macrolide-efflux protein [Carnobacterium sp. CP1]
MKNKSFRFLWIGQSMANLGDIFYIVGLISILYISTESPFILALVPFFNMFGRFISGLLSPLLLNRYSLKSLIIYSQASKTLLLFFLAIILALNLTSNVLVIISFVFVIAFLDGWAAPASQAMLPRLVAENELVKANSFFSIVSETVNLGGWALGGLVVALLSGQNVILITVALYLIATVLMTRIIDPIKFKRKFSEGRRSGELKEGWQIVWRSPLYKSLHVIIVFEAFANVVWIASILYVFVSEVLGKSEAWWGYINTSFFVGMVVGGFICSYFTLAFEKNLKYVLITFSFGISILTLLFGLTTIAWLSLFFAELNGISQQLKAIASNTFLQKSASTEELPKIYAVQSALVSLLFAISSLLFGALTEIWDVRISFIVSAVLLGIAAIYAAINHRVFSVEKSS